MRLVVGLDDEALFRDFLFGGALLSDFVAGEVERWAFAVDNPPNLAVLALYPIVNFVVLAFVGQLLDAELLLLFYCLAELLLDCVNGG
jgi:hypothetical protein